MSRSRPASPLVLSFATILLGGCASAPPDRAVGPLATPSASNSAVVAVIEIPRAPTSTADAAPSASAPVAPEEPPKEVPWPTFPRASRDALPPARTSKTYANDAIDVVNAMQPLFRKCYDRALRDQRGLAGKARLSINVGTRGYVEGVKVLDSSGLPERLVDCCIEATMSRMFPAHGTPEMEIVAPLAFQQQE